MDVPFTIKPLKSISDGNLEEISLLYSLLKCRQTFFSGYSVISNQPVPLYNLEDMGIDIEPDQDECIAELDLQIELRIGKSKGYFDEMFAPIKIKEIPLDKEHAQSSGCGCFG